MLIITFVILFYSYPSTQEVADLAQFDKKYDSLTKLVESNMHNNPDKALYFGRTALGLATSVNNIEAVVNAKIMLSNVYRKQSFFDLAFEATCEAYDMCPDTNSVLRAQTCIEKALIYRNYFEKDKALKYANEAQVIYQSKSDSIGLAESYNCIGLIFMGNNEKNRAASYFSKALKIYDELQLLTGLAKELNNLTLVSDDYQENIVNINRAIEINKAAYNLWSLGENYNNLASQYIYLKNFDEALMLLDVALEYINIVHTSELLLDNYEYRRRLYIDMHNYKEAYNSLCDYNELKKTMPSIRRLADVEMMLAERKIFTQKRELKLKEQTLLIEKQQKLVVFILSGAVCLILVVFVYVIRYRNKKNLIAQQLINEKDKLIAEASYNNVRNELKQLGSELNNNKRELTNLAFHIKSRNDVLNKIREQIKAVIHIAPSNIKNELKKIGLFISQYHKNSNSLNQTISAIDNISTEYISRLRVLHPDLTKNQIVLASLLRIDLSSKEIALLIDSSAKTVNMARYRLRKQLRLDSDAGLSDYLKQV